MGLKPIQPNRTQTERNDQNNIVLEISKNEPLKTLLVINGNKNNTINAKPSVITPPNLLGIDLNIA
jgi:hypothetical protein